MQDDAALKAEARRRAENKIGFYVHLTAYIVVNTFLIMVWWFTGGGFPWFLFIMFFWGIGLVSHAFSVYGSGRFVDNLTQQEYEKLRNRKP